MLTVDLRYGCVAAVKMSRFVFLVRSKVNTAEMIIIQAVMDSRVSGTGIPNGKYDLRYENIFQH